MWLLLVRQKPTQISEYWKHGFRLWNFIDLLLVYFSSHSGLFLYTTVKTSVKIKIK